MQAPPTPPPAHVIVSGGMPGYNSDRGRRGPDRRRDRRDARPLTGRRPAPDPRRRL